MLSAFNFPVAVYGWCVDILGNHLTTTYQTIRNLALAFAAGNATIWKPSPSTPLCSIAVTKIVSGVLERNGIPGAVAGLVTGGKDVGSAVVESRDVDLGHCGSLACPGKLSLITLCSNQCHSPEVRTSGGW